VELGTYTDEIESTIFLEKNVDFCLVLFRFLPVPV